MVKECKILIKNDFVTVVRFGKKEIQLPFVDTNKNSILVAYDKGNYFVVDKDYKENKVVNTDNLNKTKRKNTKSKKSNNEATNK